MWNQCDVDMTRGKVALYPMSTSPLAGRALASAIFCRAVPPGVAPLAPENKLVLCPGLLAGTPAPAGGRLSVVTKSPLSGKLQESNAGGTAAGIMARLGLRCLTIGGAATSHEPFVLVLTSSGGQLEPLAKATEQKHPPTAPAALCKALQARFGKQCAVLCTGPAADNGALTATLQITDKQGAPVRTCGKGGLGAVLAAKGIKAIVFCPVQPSAKAALPAPSRYRAAFIEGAQQFTSAAHSIAYSDAALAQAALFLTALEAQYAKQTSKAGHPPAPSLPALPELPHVPKPAASPEGSTQPPSKRKSTHPACQPGCPMQCPHHEQEEHSANAPHTPAFDAASLGLHTAKQVQELEAACNGAGLDLVETVSALALAVQAGLLPHGNSAAMAKAIASAANGEQPHSTLTQGAVAYARHLGVTPGTAGKKKQRLPDKEQQSLRLAGAMADTLGLCLFMLPALATEQGMAGLAALLGALPGWSSAQGSTKEEPLGQVLRIASHCLKQEGIFNTAAQTFLTPGNNAS